MIRFSPERERVASLTPSESMRLRSTSTTRSVLDALALVPSSASRVSKTIWVPPLRSSPSFGFRNQPAVNAPAMMSRDMSARSQRAPDPGELVKTDYLSRR